MRKPKKRCKICHQWYEPDARTRRHQTCCGKAACRKERKVRANRSWRDRSPDYGRSRRLKVCAWAKGYPDYWQQYRRNHPEYRDRDNQRRRVSRKRAQNAAKQDAIREISVEKLTSIPRFEPETAAKQVPMDRRVDAVVEYLLWQARAAKHDAIEMVSGGVP